MKVVKCDSLNGQAAYCNYWTRHFYCKDFGVDKHSIAATRVVRESIA